MTVLDGDPSLWDPRGARRAVTVGVFDGLHLGHRHVLQRVRQRADTVSEASCVVTFDPHPLAVVAPEHAPRMLTTVDHRVRLLAAEGVDVVAVVPFDEEVRSWSPAEFVADLLVGRLGASSVIVGEDFRFGRDRTGHVGLLREMGAAFGFTTDIVPLVGGDSPVSSTRIRSLVAAGDVAGAARALGRWHLLSGEVVAGDGRGRTIGVPTANVAASPGLAWPARGVYAVRVLGVPGEADAPGVANVGIRPTFGGEQEVLEVHVLDRDDDLYGTTLDVCFVERIRDEQRFADVDALVDQIHRDIAEARGILDNVSG